jgi:hypothetical protein
LDEKVKLELQIHKEHHQLVIKDAHHWYENELFTWNWWVLVAFLIIPWIIWAKIVDRKKLLEIVLVGTLAIIPTVYLDAIGVDINYWIYPTQLIPITPRAAPFDMCIIPVALMLLYQFFKSWKSYLFALLIMALLFAFIGEPASKAMKLVYYIKWKYFYSFLYYLILGLTLKFVVNKFKKLYLKE